MVAETCKALFQAARAESECNGRLLEGAGTTLNLR